MTRRRPTASPQHGTAGRFAYPRHSPQQTYLSQHGSENHVSESLGEDLSGLAKRVAL